MFIAGRSSKACAPAERYVSGPLLHIPPPTERIDQEGKSYKHLAPLEQRFKDEQGGVIHGAQGWGRLLFAQWA